MMESVVITGVSSGIGLATARDLVGAGFRVFGSVRSDADARRVRRELPDAFEPVVFDVTDPGATSATAGHVEEALGGDTLSGLVNNAGIAVPGPLMHIDLEDVRRQFEVNVIGLLRVTQAFLPLLGARADGVARPGRIVNMSSISGRVALPLEGAYDASKHAVEALSDVLRRELMIYGIDVIVVQPGSVDTPIWDKLPDANAFNDTDYAPVIDRELAKLEGRRRDSLAPEAIARVVRRALTARRPKSRYAVPVQALTRWHLPRLLPDRWFDQLVARELQLEPGDRTPTEPDRAVTSIEQESK